MTDELSDRALALSYAPRRTRAALAALFALDDMLGRILRTTREPMAAQLRLTWWHEALTRLDAAPAPAEPVLRALAAEVLPRGVAGATLALLVEGWEELLEPPDDAALGRFAVGRGGALFTAAAAVLGASPRDAVAAAGDGWALADLARHCRDPALAVRAAALARPALDEAAHGYWSRAGRPIGALAQLARAGLGASHPLVDTLRLLRFRAIGR